MNRSPTLWHAESQGQCTGAVIVGRYRYTLWRRWNDAQPCVLFIMLNPSEANEVKNDPTLRRCIGFAQSWGYGSLEVVNLFAYISSDPSTLKQVEDAVGAENDVYIQQAITNVALIVCAWGACKHIGQRDGDVLHLLNEREAHCLGRTQGGFPRHPLYLARETALVRYS